MNKKFCKNGHDLSILGRGKAGQCIKCTRVWYHKYLIKNKEKVYAKNKQHKTEHRAEYLKKGEIYRASHKFEAKRSWLRYKYKLSIAQFELMGLRQNYRCAICKNKCKLHVDHCHDTNRVRGLLCNKCNLGIGGLQHNPVFLASAIKYLKSQEEQYT